MSKPISTKLISLIEQGSISGSNFLFMLLAARLLPIADFGIFSFALAILLVVQGFQRAFVTLPLLTSLENEAELNSDGQWAKLQLWCTVISSLVFFVAYLVACIFGGWLQQSFALALILLFPLFYLEFARRVMLRAKLIKRFLLASLLYFCTILLGLAIFYFNDVGVYGFSALMAISAVVYTLAAGRKIIPEKVFTPFNANSWDSQSIFKFGKWAAASSIAFSGYNFAIQAILGFIAGPLALGLYAAAKTLTQPVQTILQAMDSVDKQRMTKSYLDRNAEGLWRALQRAWIWLLSMTGAYLLVLLMFGDFLILQLFDGKYDNLMPIVYGWMFVMLTMILVQPLESGLYVIKRPDLLFYGRLIAALLAMALSFYAINRFGVVGALIALGFGWLVSGLVAFFQLKKIA